MARYAGRRPTPQERFLPRPSLRWLRWLFGVTESGSESLSGSESNQINELRPCRRSRSTRRHSPRGPGETNFVVGIDSDADSDPTPRRKEAEQHLAADAPKGAPLKHGVGLSSRVHRRATRPAVAAAASAVDCGAGVPPARGWVGGERAVRWTAMQAGGLHHKRDSLPAPLSPVAPLVVGLFKPGSPARHSSAPSLLGLFDA